MSDDMDDRVRDLLRRKADDLPLHRGVPRSVMSRARRRIALNALAALVAVAVVGGGAFAGVRALVAPSVVPGGSPAPSVVPTTPSPAPRPSPPARRRRFRPRPRWEAQQ